MHGILEPLAMGVILLILATGVAGWRWSWWPWVCLSPWAERST